MMLVCVNTGGVKGKHTVIGGWGSVFDHVN